MLTTAVETGRIDHTGTAEGNADFRGLSGKRRIPVRLASALDIATAAAAT
ncbi:hypothetical protein WQQ_22060 [Hydrocarboniphaga effusa AP103]|uniref:Uncharacterized protein n=1 Tax=Hydrocarboniphaga effusa AP103 TaxID=1172194 RepID=I7ZJH3_9GAMM|nr:hypothetical protein WQQ_22060 [Hydrocarboniphaga effusa AP103]